MVSGRRRRRQMSRMRVSVDATELPESSTTHDSAGSVFIPHSVL